MKYFQFTLIVLCAPISIPAYVIGTVLGAVVHMYKRGYWHRDASS